MDNDGERFSVGMPWRPPDGRPDLQSNIIQAEQRLHSLERSLAKKPDVQHAYRTVIDTYFTKGYIEHVPDNKIAEDDSDQWYLPHFPVVRADKTTTKVRVVFDASALWDGRTLNEQVFADQKTQNDLVHVLLRFCM